MLDWKIFFCIIIIWHFCQFTFLLSDIFISHYLPVVSELFKTNGLSSLRTTQWVVQADGHVNFLNQSDSVAPSGMFTTGILINVIFFNDIFTIWHFYHNIACLLFIMLLVQTRGVELKKRWKHNI